MSSSVVTITYCNEFPAGGETIMSWPGFNVPSERISPSPKLTRTFVNGNVPVFSIETLAMMKRLCFSFVGSTIKPYSPDEKPVGKRRKTAAKIPATPAEIHITATDFESTNTLSIISWFKTFSLTLCSFEE